MTFQAVNEEPRRFTAARVSTAWGTWSVDGGVQALDMWLSYRDDFTPFISVSFPLEFSSTNQPDPPVHSEPQVLSPKPAAVGLLGDLQMLGFW